MDFGRAFAFVAKDGDWLKKILIGGLISLIPLAGGLIVYGYVLEVIRDAYSGADNRLPDWDDIGGYLISGLIVAAGLLIWLIPVVALGACIGILAGVSGGSSEVAAILASVFGICLIGILSLIYFIVFIPVVIARYAIHRRFNSMFQFDEIIDEVRRAGSSLLLLLLIVIVAQFVASAGYLACLIGVLFTSFYAQLVIGHAAGQMYRNAGDDQMAQEIAAF